MGKERIGASLKFGLFLKSLSYSWTRLARPPTGLVWVLRGEILIQRAGMGRCLQTVLQTHHRNLALASGFAFLLRRSEPWIGEDAGQQADEDGYSKGKAVDAEQSNTAWTRLQQVQYGKNEDLFRQHWRAALAILGVRERKRYPETGMKFTTSVRYLLLFVRAFVI